MYSSEFSLEDPLKMKRTYEKLKQDGQATMPLKEQFWGYKFGMLP